jgi:hypothetical protein
MFSRQIIVASIATLFASFAPAAADAQVLYGSVLGNVTDTTGGAIAAATVTLTETATNQVHSAVSSASGGYSFSDIAVGNYVLAVTKAGFQTYTARDIAVSLNSATRVNAELRVGAVSDSVVVSAESAVLQEDRADVHTEVTTKSLQELPVASRSFQALLGLTPGASTPTYFQAGGINNPSRSMTVTINGTPNADVVMSIDGVTATNQWIQPLQAYTPSIEAIEGVNTVTNSFDAEQGLAGGASVNVQVKSGTNALHGSAFEYVENRALTARNFFLPAGTPKPEGNWNIFGGTVGGPIRKDKLFYFASWEDNLERATGGAYGSNGSFQTVPTAAIRTGDFSQIGTVIYNPATGNANGTARSPFAGNTIPASQLSPIAEKLIGLLPAPNVSGSTNNYFTNPPYSSTYNKVDAKITWTATSKLNFNARIGYLKDNELTAGVYPIVSGSLNPASAPLTNKASVWTGTVAATYTLTPNLLIDGLYGLTRQHTLQYSGTGACYATQIGIPGDCQPGQRDPGQTQMIFSAGYSTIGLGGNLTEYYDPQYQFVTNATWIRASHNLKFGVDVHRLDMNHYEIGTGVPSSMTFNGGATALNGGPSPNQYNAFADFLLGLPQSETVNLDNPPLNGNANPSRPATLRSWELGLYFRDQWQVTRKFTVSYGTRWEYYPVPTRADRGIEILNFSTLKEDICGIGGNPGDCNIHVSPLQFAPRIGTAYRVTDGFVVRAGFSLNWEQDSMYRSGLYAFPTQIGLSQNGAGSYTPVGTLAAGVPLVSPVNVSSGVLTLPAGAAVTTLPSNFVRGYILSWNLTVQKSLGHGWTAQAGYVANRAIHQDQLQNINYGLPGGGSASQPFTSSLNTTAAVNVYLPMAHTYYDSLQTNVSRRFTSGLSVNSSFTWGKGISTFAGSIPIPQYFHLDKGLTGASSLGGVGDQPLRSTTAITYELPFGKGKAYLNGNRIVSAILGGWQVNTLLAAFSGQPFSVTASNASLNAPGSSQRANQVLPSVQILGGIGPGQPYFNPLAFAPVTCACFGTAGFNTLFGPALVDLDMGFFRQFPIRERLKLQFRGEIFNATNTPHFANPSGLNVSNVQYGANGSIANLNGFGVITSTVSGTRDYDQRYLRLGLRLSW